MNISAIVLAAGQSKRMGEPKMLLPWGDITVLGKVIQTLRASDVEDIVVVTNSKLAPHFTAHEFRVVLNDNGEMLESIQAGLRAQKSSAEATLICLGDQPQVEERSVRKVCNGYRESKSSIIVPSHQMRRGHPWLITKEPWGEILEMRPPKTMREFLNAHRDDIFYVECDSPTILQDLDTPADYLKYKP